MHMATLICLLGFNGYMYYIRVNMLTLSPLRVNNDNNEEYVSIIVMVKMTMMIIYVV